MAKIQMGAIVTDIRGKLNGHVFRKSATGLVIQRKSNPRSKDFYYKNPQLQTLKKGASDWNSFHALTKRDFTNFAKNNPLKNEFGDFYTISGRAMAQKLITMCNYVWGTNPIPPTLSAALKNIIFEHDYEDTYLLSFNTAPGITGVILRYEVRSGLSAYYSFAQVKNRSTALLNTQSGVYNFASILTPQEKQIADNGWLFVQMVEVNQWGWSGMHQNFKFRNGAPYDD